MAADDKISGMIFPADDKAKVSSNDSQTGFLATKLVAGANVTITENNNGANETLTIAAAGGVTGFTGSVNTAAPNNTANASRLLVDVPTTNGDLVLQPKLQGSVMLQLPDSATSGGNKRGVRAIDLQLSRTNAARVASGQDSASLGNNNLVSGAAAIAVGGTNDATGDTSIVIGIGSTSSGARAIAFGESALAGGRSMFAYGAGAPTRGAIQQEQWILSRQTTNNTTTELCSVGFYTAPDSSTRITIQADSTFAYQGLVTARRSGVANETAGWEIKGVIQNSGGTTAFVGTPTVTLLGASAGASTWTIAVTANDTNDNLRIDVTGETGKTINWGAFVNLMKVAG